MIDLERLSQAISTEAPCGPDTEYSTAFIAMERAKQGEPERQIGEVIIAATPPDWKQVKEQALALTQLSHDLRVVASLTIALAYTEGFKGLEQGLILANTLLDSYWECLHPDLDEEDENPAIMRRNALLELASQSFVQGLLKQTLLSSAKLGKFSIAALQEGLNLQNSTNEEEIKRYRLVEAVFQDLPPENLQVTLQLLQSCKQQTQTLQEKFESYVASNQHAPNLGPLVSLLEQASKILTNKLKLKTEANLPANEAMQANTEADGGLNSSLPPPLAQALTRDSNMPIENNDQVRQALEQICAYYARYEPSSPIPLLLKRAQRLVGKEFLEIANDLNPDSVSQFEHLFGIKE